MNRVYEIFEVLPVGSPHKVAVASGLESAKLKLHEFANQTHNECYVADARTRQIVAQVNIPPMKRRGTTRIFQISYDEQSGLQRAELLKSLGYTVMSVIGNEAARVALTPIRHYDLFIVGHAAPEEARQEIFLWLKAKYPRVKILALNPPTQELPGADYNARQNDPGNWLPIVSRELLNPGPVKASTSGA
jgi:hypothetical protein